MAVLAEPSSEVQSRDESTGSTLVAHATDHASPSPPSLDLNNSRQLTIWLGVCFALLIGMLFGIGYWANYRVVSCDRDLAAALARQRAKLQMAFDAVHLSTENSRIAMQILLQRSAPPELLGTQNANRKHIEAFLESLAQQCDSSQERQLLMEVRQLRQRYIDSSQAAIKLLLEDKNSDQAEHFMVERASPVLLEYHAAWHQFESLQLERMRAEAEESDNRDNNTVRIAMALTWLSGVLAAGIAVFATGRIRRDIELRIRMQKQLSSLNNELEQRVTERTRELASAEQQLRTSLAETQDYAGEIEAVNELAKLLQSCLTLEEAQQEAAKMLQRFFPSGAVLMMNASRNVLDVVLSWGAATSRHGPYAPESCWALRKGEAHLNGPHCTNPLCSHYDGDAVGCHLCIPMIAQGKALGILSIQDSALCGASPRALVGNRRVVKLATTVAEQVSLAFANLTLRETLKYQSVRDPLTGLFNRRHMEEGLERELRRAARKSTPVAIMMIDIDHFKRFNDSFGHEAGDVVLREFGVLLKLQIRGGDLACRYGGEEFLLIMGETDAESACKRGEILRQRVATMPVRYHGHALNSVTVSIGIAMFPAHGSSAEQLISAADAALYRAKREGRDRIALAE